MFLPLNILQAEDPRARGHEHGDSHGATIDVDLELTADIEEALLTGMDYVLKYLE